MNPEAAWTEAAKALPEGWALTGLQDVLGRSEWQATAASPFASPDPSCACCGQRIPAAREYVFGHGPSREAALVNLTAKLRARP